MDNITLARKLRRIAIRIDGYREDLPIMYPSRGDAYITMNPENISPFPSANINRVLYLGCEEHVTPDTIYEIIEMYSEAGIKRFFVWMSPCSQLEEIEKWLETGGFNPFEGTGYPTLLRSADHLPPHDTPFKIKQLTGKRITAYQEDIKKIYTYKPDQYLFSQSIDQPGFGHFVACEGKHAVAAAIICIHEDLGYLYSGATLKTHQRHGAQSALITARVNYAVEKGCAWVSSETLYMLKQSLNNLERKGFKVVYDKHVFVWNAL